MRFKEDEKIDLARFENDPKSWARDNEKRPRDLQILFGISRSQSFFLKFERFIPFPLIVLYVPALYVYLYVLNVPTCVINAPMCLKCTYKSYKYPYVFIVPFV